MHKAAKLETKYIHDELPKVLFFFELNNWRTWKYFIFKKSYISKVTCLCEHFFVSTIVNNMSG